MQTEDMGPNEGLCDAISRMHACVQQETGYLWKDNKQTGQVLSQNTWELPQCKK